MEKMLHFNQFRFILFSTVMLVSIFAFGHARAELVHGTDFAQLKSNVANDSTVVPPPTLQVAKDGSKDYATIAAALNDLPSTGGTIEVYPGTYDEKLTLNKKNIILMGMGSDASQVVITHNDFNSKINPDTGQPYGTTGSATVTVKGKDFYATNLTIKNTADFEPPNYEDNAQAVALLTKGDRSVYRACRFLGGQDTLYVNNSKRAYFYNCYIEGSCDFIFGYGKAVFDGCTIKAKTHRGLTSKVPITAQARHSSDEDNGFVFNNTDILFDDIHMNNVWLGRPWKPYSTVYFLNTRIHQNGAQVADEGWIEWNSEQGTNYLPTCTFREYNTLIPDGHGGWTEFNYSMRESISPGSNIELSSFEAEALTADNYLANDDGWNPTGASYGSLTNQTIKIEDTPYGVPGKPTIYEVTAGNQNLALYFAGNGANPPTTGYKMWAIQNGMIYCAPEELPPATMRYFVAGLANGFPAKIYVAGINAEGQGLAAESDWFTPVSDAPAIPTNIEFTDNGDGSVTMNFTIADEGSQPVFGTGSVEHAGVYTALYASKNDAFMGNAIEGTSQGFGQPYYTFENLQANTDYWVSLWVYNGKKSPTLITNFTTGGSSPGGGDGVHTFTLRARSTDGQGHVNLIVDNQIVASWTLGTDMSNYSVGNVNGQGVIEVEFDNDDYGRNVQVDYLSVDDAKRQAEDQAVNTGVWQNSSCGGSYSEWLHCNGVIEFGNTQ